MGRLKKSDDQNENLNSSGFVPGADGIYQFLIGNTESEDPENVKETINKTDKEKAMLQEAKMMYNLYSSFVEAGFNEDAAITIVIELLKVAVNRAGDKG